MGFPMLWFWNQAIVPGEYDPLQGILPPTVT
jgi:hypothetical protein